MLVITHYQRLLDYIVPDMVHVLSGGRIVRTGGKELALELEAKGYAQYQDEAASRMNAELQQSYQDRGRAALAETFAAARRGCPAAAPRRGAKPRSPFEARACRTGASRNGNTPTCAR